MFVASQNTEKSLSSPDSESSRDELSTKRHKPRAAHNFCVLWQQLASKHFLITLPEGAGFPFSCGSSYYRRNENEDYVLSSWKNYELDRDGIESRANVLEISVHPGPKGSRFVLYSDYNYLRHGHLV